MRTRWSFQPGAPSSKRRHFGFRCRLFGRQAYDREEIVAVLTRVQNSAVLAAGNGSNCGDEEEPAKLY